MRVFLLALLVMPGCLQLPGPDQTTTTTVSFNATLCSFSGYDPSSQDPYTITGCPIPILGGDLSRTRKWRVELPANITGLSLTLNKSALATGRYSLGLTAEGFEASTDGLGVLANDARQDLLPHGGFRTFTWHASVCDIRWVIFAVAVEGDMGASQFKLDYHAQAANVTVYAPELDPHGASTCNKVWTGDPYVPVGILGPMQASPAGWPSAARLPQP